MFSLFLQSKINSLTFEQIWKFYTLNTFLFLLDDNQYSLLLKAPHGPALCHLSPHWSRINEPAQDSCNKVLEPIISRSWKFYQLLINGGGTFVLSGKCSPNFWKGPVSLQMHCLQNRHFGMFTPTLWSKPTSQRLDWHVKCEQPLEHPLM